MSGEASEKPAEGSAKKHAPFFEPVALLLLSLATVGTAWCSFEAASWGSAAAGLASKSAAAAHRASTAQLKASQFTLLDVLLFSQYINARVASNEVQAKFYSERFRDEARQAFDAWMKTNPFDSTNAPAHPFLTNFYQPKLLLEAREAEEEGLKLEQKAGEAGRVARNYILITVLLASALFCGGTAAKFDNLWIRRAVLAMGLGAFVFAVIRLWVLPVQL